MATLDNVLRDPADANDFGNLVDYLNIARRVNTITALRYGDQLGLVYRDVATGNDAGVNMGMGGVGADHELMLGPNAFDSIKDRVTSTTKFGSDKGLLGHWLTDDKKAHSGELLAVYLRNLAVHKTSTADARALHVWNGCPLSSEELKNFTISTVGVGAAAGAEGATGILNFFTNVFTLAAAAGAVAGNLIQENLAENNAANGTILNANGNIIHPDKSLKNVIDLMVKADAFSGGAGAMATQMFHSIELSGCGKYDKAIGHDANLLKIFKSAFENYHNSKRRISSSSSSVTVDVSQGLSDYDRLLYAYFGTLEGCWGCSPLETQYYWPLLAYYNRLALGGALKRGGNRISGGDIYFSLTERCPSLYSFYQPAHSCALLCSPYCSSVCYSSYIDLCPPVYVILGGEKKNTGELLQIENKKGGTASSTLGGSSPLFSLFQGGGKRKRRRSKVQTKKRRSRRRKSKRRR